MAELIGNPADADTTHNDEQHAILALHRIRQQVANSCKARINGLYAPLTEHCMVMPTSSVRSIQALAGAAKCLPKTVLAAPMLRFLLKVTFPLSVYGPALPRKLAIEYLLTAGQAKQAAMCVLTAAH